MVKKKKSTESFLDTKIKNVPNIKLFFIILCIAVFGLVLGFTIIRLIFKSIAFIVLFVLVGICIYLIMKKFDWWFK